MTRLSESQRESLKAAVSKYHEALPGSEAEEYLSSRGLTGFDEVDKYRLGYVNDPLPEHEKHRGKLVIPYLRWHPRYGWTCVSLRFRAIDGSKPKYASMAGDRPRLYNTQALNAPSTEVCIAEGELDALTATLAGMPTVGVPGATLWQDHWTELFRGYRTVHVVTDGDEAGEKLGKHLAKQLSNARVVECPPGEDINSLYTKHGEERLEKLWTTTTHQ